MSSVLAKSVTMLLNTVYDRYSKPNFNKGFILSCWSLYNIDRNKQMTFYLISWNYFTILIFNCITFKSIPLIYHNLWLIALNSMSNNVSQYSSSKQKQIHILFTSNASQCKLIAKTIYCPILVEGVTRKPRYRPALHRSAVPAGRAAPDSCLWAAVRAFHADPVPDKPLWPTNHGVWRDKRCS